RTSAGSHIQNCAPAHGAARVRNDDDLRGCVPHSAAIHGKAAQEQETGRRALVAVEPGPAHAFYRLHLAIARRTASSTPPVRRWNSLGARRIPVRRADASPALEANGE